MTASQKEIYGLIGYPVKHSLSPVMHNAAFKASNINAEYQLFEVKPEELETFLLEDVFAKNISGLNITIPHKVKAREILEKKYPFDQGLFLMQENLYYVRLSGAVNTVKRINNSLEYWNTDASGFIRSLREVLKFDPENKKVLLLGCGGAGRAIISSLSWKNGARKIYVNDIKKEAMDSAKEYFLQFPHLINKLQFISKDDIASVIKECDLLVNAKPVGMNGEDTPLIDRDLLHSALFVYDIVYTRNKPTRLVTDAQSQGLNVMTGLDMLLYQGADAFELWTAKKAPVDIMRQALTAAIYK